MSKIVYDVKTFRPEAASVVATAEQICAQYAAEGFSLTLRQLYYRFIAGDLLPESRRDPVSGTKNTEKNYKWLGNLISDARVGGMIDWNHLEDRTRAFEGGDGGYGSPERAIELMASWYNISHWDGQDEYVEVWVEKEALIDVISRPASRWDVGHFACKGSPSTSSMHEAAQRLRRYERAGRDSTVIYLGDHDPTGIDISRDIQDRLHLFGSRARVERIALNMDQVLQYDPPPSPVKLTDSRAGGYIDTFGTDECWELDALEPAVLDDLIETEILRHLDQALREERIRREERERETLNAISENFAQVVRHLTETGYIEPDDEDDS